MQEIRNIALIAHVDHGKTTLVDRMIYQANLVRQPENLGQLILDNNDIERERGITILAKNVSVIYKGVKINIIDTPGHSDFGGEVERVLNMADGVLLLVDAFEGCMPQTRFVLQKALELGKKPIVVVNKVDKPNCRPDEVQEEVFDLMCSLNATDDQLDFKTVFGSAKQGWMSEDWRKPTSDITPLLDAILAEIPAPKVVEGTPQLQVTSLEYSPYVGRIAVGKLTRGELRTGQQISLCKRYDVVEKHKIKQLMVFDGLGKANVDSVQCGDICAVVGIDGFEIGDTIADSEHPEALPPISIDEPTMSMLFTINNSPFFGKDGKFVTSRHIKDRLDKELEKNLALKVKPGLTASQGEAIMAHRFKEYQPYKGEIENRTNGSLVSLETGTAIAYSMNKLLDRGKFFIDPGDDIYCGEVVGEHTRERDLNINICKTKKLTNVRAAGSDEKVVLPPPVKMSLEEMLEYIREDELVEVTPHHLRMRKILLDPMDRKRSGNSGDEE